MAENSNIPAAALPLLMGLAVGGGGTHLVGSSGDAPVNNLSIQDCTPFSQHAREHEQHKCEIKLNGLRVVCNK